MQLRQQNPGNAEGDPRKKSERSKQENVFQAQDKAGKIGIFDGSSTKEDHWLGYSTENIAHLAPPMERGTH